MPDNLIPGEEEPEDELRAMRAADIEIDIPGSRARGPVTDEPAYVPPAYEDDGEDDEYFEETYAPRLALPWFDHLWGLLLGLAGLLLVVLTYQGIGWSWDEAYYFEPSRLAAEFVQEIIDPTNTRAEMFGAAKINQYWTSIHECPAFAKLLIGYSDHLFSGLIDRMTALRLPSAVAFGLTLYLLYLLATVYYGRFAGFAVVIIYCTMPRVFGHAHFACTETPLNFILILALYCFLRGLTSTSWAVIWGIVFGLALNTKINAILLPAILLPWALVYARRRSVNNLYAMLFLAPLVWILTWPWLWHDTLLKILNYVAFFAQHQETAVYYLGQKWGYGGLAAPWHYPLAMIAVTTPVLSLLLIIGGAIRAVLRPRLEPHGLLFIWYALVMLAIASRPSAPKYDGIRLFLAAMPILALLAAAGCAKLMVVFSDDQVSEGSRLSWRSLAGSVIMVALLTAGAISLVYSAPGYLSYYNIVVGGIHGAADDFGFETTYWADAVNEDVIEYMNETLPSGARVKPLAMHGLVFGHYRDVFELLRPDIQFPAEPPFDIHIVQHRRGMFASAEKWFTERVPPSRVFRFRGVPMISFYDRPSPRMPAPVELPEINADKATNPTTTLSTPSPAEAGQ
ncbi:ArnT family glycosyltransferase [Candidatus Sumerlaeota bacterium]